MQLQNEREELQTEFVHQHVEAGRLLLSHSSFTSSIDLEELPTDEVNINEDRLRLPIRQILYCLLVDIVKWPHLQNLGHRQSFNLFFKL